MAYERYPRGDDGDRANPQDYGRDYGSGRDYGYSSARDYEAAGETGDRGSRGPGRGGYGPRDAGGQRPGTRDPRLGNRGEREGPAPQYHGSYASDGHRFEDVGRFRHADDDYARRGRPNDGQSRDRDDQDRGFFQRAGDEVRSWFGDDDAERRREADARADERADQHRDRDYHSWRSGQIAALDRDYDEYRQENRTRFENEFSTWRTSRQGQRDSLGKVSEHMEVVGSDDAHVGTVDKVRGDHILLTKNDVDAGGRHHAIPSRWVASVDTKVMLTKTAAEAKQQWQDEDRNQAMFQYGDDAGRDGTSERTARASSAATSTAKTY